MDDLFDSIAAAADIDRETARLAVGHILVFIAAEGSDPAIEEMLEKTPGARETMLGVEGDGGSATFGGGIMALGSKLMSLGLDMTQIRTIAGEIVAHAKAHAGDETVNRAIASVPALAQFV